MIDGRSGSTWRLFIIFQCLYALTSSGNAFRLPDEYSTYYQVERFVDAGDLSVPQTIPRNQFFGKVGLDGKPYAPWGPLTALLALPHHLVGRAVARASGIPRTNTEVWTFVVSGFTMLSTSTAAALAVMGFHRAALLLGATPSTAWRLSLMLGGASVLWTYGTNLYSEAWQAAAFIWAVVCLLNRRIAGAAILIAIAGLTKFTSIVFTPAFVAAVLVDRSTPFPARLRAALGLSAGIVFSLGVHFAWNDFRFGNPFDFGYNWVETVPELPVRVFLLSDLPRGLAILLFSPGKSILVWAPVLWLAITRFRKNELPIRVGVLVSLGLGLMFFGSYLYRTAAIHTARVSSCRSSPYCCCPRRRLANRFDAGRSSPARRSARSWRCCRSRCPTCKTNRSEGISLKPITTNASRHALVERGTAIDSITFRSFEQSRLTSGRQARSGTASIFFHSTLRGRGRRSPKRR